MKGIDIALGDNNLCLRCCAVTARPSGEGITCAGGVVQREGRRLYIISGVVGSGHRAACKVVGNVVGDGIPLGEESHRATICRRQVVDALLVGIDHFAIGRRCPAGEGIARAGEGVGGEGLGRAVGKRLAVHRTRTGVSVELHGVGVVNQLRGEGQVAATHGETVVAEGVAVRLIDDMLACACAVTAVERQLKAFAVVFLIIIYKAVVHVVGCGRDAAEAAANGHLAGATDAGDMLGIVISDDFVTVVVIDVEVGQHVIFMIALADDGTEVAVWF